MALTMRDLRRVRNRALRASLATHVRDETLTAPTRDPLVIRRAAFDCPGQGEPDRRVRLLGVRVGELERG